LARAGYHRLADLRGESAAALAALHGMGPKALDILKTRLAQAGIELRE